MENEKEGKGLGERVGRKIRKASPGWNNLFIA